MLVSRSQCLTYFFRHFISSQDACLLVYFNFQFKSVMCQNIWNTILLTKYIFELPPTIHILKNSWTSLEHCWCLLVETRHEDAEHAVSRPILSRFLDLWRFGFVTNDDFRDRSWSCFQITMNLICKIKEMKCKLVNRFLAFLLKMATYFRNIGSFCLEQFLQNQVQILVSIPRF